MPQSTLNPSLTNDHAITITPAAVGYRDTAASPQRHACTKRPYCSPGALLPADRYRDVEVQNPKIFRIYDRGVPVPGDGDGVVDRLGAAIDRPQRGMVIGGPENADIRTIYGWRKPGVVDLKAEAQRAHPNWWVTFPVRVDIRFAGRHPYGEITRGVAGEELAGTGVPTPVALGMSEGWLLLGNLLKKSP
ncbi:hypothetical protein HWV62_4345 [Athelia sp. TMB]|nr:hypothetical protein HWV62_4345 [Athelia sp. TMB]